MSQRQLVDTSGAVPSGRYAARLNLAGASLPNASPASGGGHPIPVATMSRSGQLGVTSGAGVLQAAKGMGMQSAPVAMTMADLRRANKAGLLANSNGVQNISAKHERQIAGGVSIVIDLKDLMTLSVRLNAIAVGYQRQHEAISKAINDGARKLQTDLKRKIQKWTGMKRQKRIADAFQLLPSNASTMTAKLNITGRHVRITKADFGAAWSRGNPGGTHSAWGRAQMAKGSFMAFSGRGGDKYGGGLLFKRVAGAGRFPIAPLWGPSLAREVIRHREEVDRELTGVVRAKVLATAERLLAIEIAKASG